MGAGEPASPEWPGQPTIDVTATRSCCPWYLLLSTDPWRLSLHDINVKLLSRLHTGLYRVTNGRIGRRLVDNDVLLLTTTGRTTGTKHTVPLLYLRDGDRIVVIASYGGRPNHPGWYRNLVSDPQATVQILGDTYPVRATTMSPEERAEWWPRIVEAYGDYAVYQSRTDREIPVVWLDT